MRCVAVLFFLVSLSGSAQRQVIKGQLYWAPDQSSTSIFKDNIVYKDKPVEIIVFEQVTPEEVTMTGGHIRRVNTREVARTFCKWDGSFRIKVDPGRYSVFAFVDGHYFGNLKDAEGNLSPVTVLPRGTAWITITMDYASKP